MQFCSALTSGNLENTFCFEGKVAELADVWPHISVCSDVLLQHAGFLTANATLLTDIFPSAATTNVNVVLIGFIPAEQKRRQLYFHFSKG